ncbi:MAG: sulfurtransferase [Bacteroidota bacterium]
MFTTPLISPADAAMLVGSPDVVFVDARFRLTDTAFGRRAHAEGHIPGAVYADLDRDLSGPIINGETSRHPLPDVDALAHTLGRWSITDHVRVIAYDDLGGAIASRLWWMLRWLGHEAVAVLDGGWPRWVAEGLPTTDLAPSPPPRTFTPREQPHMLATMDEVQRRLNDPAWCLVDARAPQRYAGLEEPLDPVGGHIPGAVNRFFKDNLNADGTFQPPEVLQRRFADVDAAPEVVCYCGSGVTAAHNALAMVRAGLPMPRLYAGSWSEWITDPANPVASNTAS